MTLAALGVSLDDLVARLNGDQALVADVCTVFVIDSARMLRNLSSALYDADANRLIAAAHILKGAVSSFTTGAPLQAAIRVEQLARRGEFDAAADAVLNLMRLVTALRDDLTIAAATRRMTAAAASQEPYGRPVARAVC
jgi:hypothetical protein